jgi:hypothetical protein
MKNLLYIVLFFLILHLILYFFNIDIFEYFDKSKKNIEENENIDECINTLSQSLEELKEINK